MEIRENFRQDKKRHEIIDKLDGTKMHQFKFN